MNAVMRNYDMTGDAAMPASDNDNQLAIQVAELRSDVRHVQSDVTDIKADVRDLRKDVREVQKDILEVRKDMAQQFEKVYKTISDAKIWALVLYIGLAGSLFYVLAKGFKWL